MALSIDDMREWLAILREHPEWKAEVRREVLSEELLTLPELVRQNGEDIRALREVVAQNSADIEALKEVVAQNSVDIQALKEVVAQNSADIQALKEVVAQNSVDIRQNSADIADLTREVRALVQTVTRLDGRVGHLEGGQDEWRWRANFTGRFGQLVSRSKLVTASELDAFEDAWDDGRISDVEALSVRRVDLLITGVRRIGTEKLNVLLVVEVSRTIEEQDILRARSRADILRRVGYEAVPVVAGSAISDIDRSAALSNGVEVVLNGVLQSPSAA